MRQTLFKLNTGQHPQLGVGPTQMSTVEAMDSFTQRLDHIQEEADDDDDESNLYTT